MPVQLLPEVIVNNLAGPAFFGYQVLSDCSLHPNGTAECRGTNCEAGYGRRRIVLPDSATEPAAPTRIRCERFAAIPFAELARNGSGCGDALDALLKNVTNQTFYPREPAPVSGLLEPGGDCGASGLVKNSFLLADDPDDEQFTLRLNLTGGPCPAANHPDVYAQCATGRLSLSPTDITACAGTYTASLVATDAAGMSVVVGGGSAEWQMEFLGRAPLAIIGGSVCGDQQGVIQSRASASRFYVTETAIVEGFTGACNDSAQVFAGDQPSVSYELNVEGTVEGSTFAGDSLINAKTGRLAITPVDADLGTNFTARLVAFTTWGVRLNHTVADWTFVPTLRAGDPPLDIFRVAAEARNDGGGRGGFGGAIQVRYQDPNTPFEPQQLTDRSKWAVGTTYRLPRVNLTLGGSQAADVTPTFELDPVPDGFLISPTTGEVLGVPTEAADWLNATTSCTLYATADGFARTPLGTITFEFMYEDADIRSDARGPGGSPCENGGERSDGAVEFDDRYSCRCMSGFLGNNCEIPPQGGSTKPYMAITGIAVLPDHQVGYASYDTRIDPTARLSMSRTTWSIGDVFRLPGFTVNGTVGPGGNSISIGCTDTDTTQGRAIILENMPPGFFIDTNTGEMLGNYSGPPTGNPPYTTTPYTTTLVVSDPDNISTTVVGEITFDFQYKDTDPRRTTAVGPNGRECAHGGSRVERSNGLEFDNRYRCDCTSTLHSATNQPYGGPNCEEVPTKASASSSSTDSGVMVGASLGAVMCLMLAALVAFRVQVYRLKHRPVDVGTTQEEVLASLGLAATQDISPAELGISLLFDRALHPGGTDGGEAQFETDLVAVLRRAAPQIKAGLQAAKITCGAPASRRVLVVVPKSKIALPAEAVVELLATKAAKGLMAVGDGGRRVVDASVAVPRRVPREVPRRALTRLRLLGEGVFGEVHKYQLEEKLMPSFFVAAKSVRKGKASGSADAREALLREAALGALLEHRNVLATVGVVTRPRDVPALLLLSFCPEGTLEALAATATATSVTVAERLTYCAQTLQGLQYIASIRIVHRDVAARNVLLDSTMTCKVRTPFPAILTMVLRALSSMLRGVCAR